jgi:hypothetical protein
VTLSLAAGAVKKRDLRSWFVREAAPRRRPAAGTVGRDRAVREAHQMLASPRVLRGVE